MRKELRLAVTIVLLAAAQACLPAAAAPTSPHPAAPGTVPPVTPPASLTPSACAEVGEGWVSPGDAMPLVCVPAGEFLMGAAETDTVALPDESPQHRVYLDAFWIDRSEVTNSMFARCVTEGACHPRTYSPYLWGVSSKTRKAYYDNPAFDNYPVIMLDGDEAAAYCRWAGRRLPTEAQWEKAARGPDARRYPWGAMNPDCSLANYLGCSNPADTTEVSAQPAGASPYGALNMAGNVWEWTADWYAEDYYAHSPERNPTGPVTGTFHTLRGGGLTTLTHDLRLTHRVGSLYHWADGEVGFRCALNAVSP